VRRNTEPSTADELLEDARQRIVRLEPRDALDASEAGALVIDLRTDHARQRDGIVPGSLHIPRSVLEWRIDPRSPWRNTEVGGTDQRLIILCAQGFSSSLAAVTAIELGFEATCDVIGGFEAWSAAGLPTRQPCWRTEDDPLPGMRPRDWGQPA
jgi:rhodanese-related sulfurtransferase